MRKSIKSTIKNPVTATVGGWQIIDGNGCAIAQMLDKRLAGAVVAALNRTESKPSAKEVRKLAEKLFFAWQHKKESIDEDHWSYPAKIKWSEANQIVKATWLAVARVAIKELRK